MEATVLISIIGIFGALIAGLSAVVFKQQKAVTDGKVIPEPTHNKIVAEKDARIEVLEAAHKIDQENITELIERLKEVFKAGQVSVYAVQQLPQPPKAIETGGE